MDNIESMEKYGEHIRETNSLQLELVQRQNLGTKIDDAAITQWIDLYSKEFHYQMELKSSANPLFWEELKDKDTREHVLAELEATLYQEEPLRHAA